MRCLSGIVLNVLTALSLLLCVGTCVLWARSYWRSDAVAYEGREGHRAVQWARGVIAFGSDNVGVPQGRLRLDSWRSGRMDVRVGSGRWTRYGFGYELSVTSANSLPAASLVSMPMAPPATIVCRRIGMPLWPFAVASSVLPGHGAVIRLRRWSRRRANRCVACGYDLHGNVSGVCPECGTAVVKGVA